MAFHPDTRQRGGPLKFSPLLVKAVFKDNHCGVSLRISSPLIQYVFYCKFDSPSRPSPDSFTPPYGMLVDTPAGYTSPMTTPPNIQFRQAYGLLINVLVKIPAL